MTNTALSGQNLSQKIQNVIGALHGSVIAIRRLAVALWQSLLQRNHHAQPTLTAREEADNLRVFADQQINNDPRFAQDIYAAAERHELAARAG